MAETSFWAAANVPDEDFEEDDEPEDESDDALLLLLELPLALVEVLDAALVLLSSGGGPGGGPSGRWPPCVLPDCWAISVLKALISELLREPSLSLSMAEKSCLT